MVTSSKSSSSSAFRKMRSDPKIQSQLTELAKRGKEGMPQGMEDVLTAQKGSQVRAEVVADRRAAAAAAQSAGKVGATAVSELVAPEAKGASKMQAFRGELLEKDYEAQQDALERKASMEADITQFDTEQAKSELEYDTALAKDEQTREDKFRLAFLDMGYSGKELDNQMEMAGFIIKGMDSDEPLKEGVDTTEEPEDSSRAPKRDYGPYPTDPTEGSAYEHEDGYIVVASPVGGEHAAGYTESKIYHTKATPPPYVGTEGNKNWEFMKKPGNRYGIPTEGYWWQNPMYNRWTGKSVVKL